VNLNLESITLLDYLQKHQKNRIII